jgi:hypothetical protein
MVDKPQDQDTGFVHARGETFGKVFDSLMHDLEISDGAVRLYAHMHWRYGRTKRMFQGKHGMAEQLGVQKRTIDSRIDELAAKDWIIVIRRRHASGDNDTNVYHVFESQSDCREFRREYKPSTGETVAPKPKLLKRKAASGRDAKNCIPLVSNFAPNTEAVDPDAVKKIPADSGDGTGNGRKAGSYGAAHPELTDEELDAQAAELTRQKTEAALKGFNEAAEREALLEAITEIFNAGGGEFGEAGMYMRMLRGTVKSGRKKKDNLDEFDLQAHIFTANPVTAAELREWSTDYRKTILKDSANATMVRVPLKVAGAIDAWRIGKRKEAAAQEDKVAAGKVSLVEAAPAPFIADPKTPEEKAEIERMMREFRQKGKR